MTETPVRRLQDLSIEPSHVVLCRVDFNVPLNGTNIRDDHRIQAALPTLNAILDTGAKLVLCSHLGRPKGQANPRYSLSPVAARLAELLDRTVVFSHDKLSSETKQLIQDLPENGVLLLENLRFDPAETRADEGLARHLAEFADVFINDAFGAMHREHCSITALPKHIEVHGIGLLVEQELAAIGALVSDVSKPYGAIIGGSKVSDKIGVIESLVKRVDHLFIGGAMAYTFLAAKDEPVGASRVDVNSLPLATAILELCEANAVTVHLPIDHVVAEHFDESAPSQLVAIIPDDHIGMDIGPETVSHWAAILKSCKTIFWNGPLGVFEWASFSQGTEGVAKAVAAAKGFTVVGGGDSAAAAIQFGYGDKMNHISTGGGASLEYLEFGDLPGLKALRG
jgi:phosphoglycerate kinase